ncbi:DJ-1/PfpI family protein [Paenibacillus sp. CC-CFT747]|nr:DJ-1/PfpI family protein [Paenibacillus sp. CC-CFT747]
MKMAFVLFDGMTFMDLAGFYEAITWLGILKIKENVSWRFCADQPEVKDDRGMKVKADLVLPPLSQFDLVFLPGGMATRKLRFDEAFMEWIRTAESVPYKVSVCTGALLWGAAGFLEGKRATTNPSAYDLLAPYCAEVVKARAVKDGDSFTGGGVTASVDLGLFMVEKLTDSETVRQVQKKLVYPYYQAGQASEVYGLLTPQEEER